MDTCLGAKEGKETKITDVATILLIVSLLLSRGLIALPPVKASFDPSQAAYYDRVKDALSLTPEQEAAIAKNGFITVEISNTSDLYLDPKLRFEDFYYRKVYANDLPVFVTTDSILHLFHVVFDCSLKILENRTLYPMLLEVTQFAFNTTMNDYDNVAHDDSMKYWAIRNSTVYFAVALSLLTNETVTVPEELSDDMNFYLNQIYADNPQFLMAGQWFLPEPPYVVEVEYDFTQFTVRGHYLGDPRLEQYFRTFMWYGQWPIFIPRNDEQYWWFVPHFDEAMIVHIRDVLRTDPQYFEKWMQLYNVTSALVGESDSIGLLNLETALQNVFGEADTYLDQVAIGDGLTRLKEELSKPEYQQQILSQALVSEMPGAVLPYYPLIFQFMGQRFVPDSYIFQLLCWDKVGTTPKGERRILPKGPDVFAVLGSERAYQLLIPDFVYEDYEKNLEALKQDFQNITAEEWVQSSYMAWVHSLEGLADVECGDEYPEFMRSLAWQDEKLNTALGSWAQLRHDTILYAKQTYIPALVCSYPEAFVEPYPTFYSRMQKLADRTLEAVNILQLSSFYPEIIGALQTIKNVTQQLEVISAKELAKEPLTPEEIEFIKQIAWMCGSGGFIGWYVDTVHSIASAANSTSALEAPVIADVATFPPGDIQYPPQILHVGVGYVNALVVLFPRPNGTLVAAVGPVFSYYEFRLIGDKRLNDKEWKEMLKWDNRSAYLPEWLRDIYGAGEPWPVTEYPNSAIIVVLLATSLTFLTLATIIKTRRGCSRLNRKSTVKNG